MSEEKEPDYEKKGLIIGGLWKTPKEKIKSGEAKSLAGGYFGSLRIVIVPNKNKKSENSPDLLAILFNNEKKYSSTTEKEEEDNLPF